MEQYKSTHTGEQIDTAVDKVINEELPIASSTKLGGVKVGNNLEVASDGTLSAKDNSYTLPIASSSTLGGIKVGENLSISEDGTLSASGGSSGGGTKLYMHTLEIIGTYNYVETPMGTSTSSFTGNLTFIVVSTSQVEYSDLIDLGEKSLGIISFKADYYNNLKYSSRNVYGLSYLIRGDDDYYQYALGYYVIKRNIYCEINGDGITSFTDTVTEL